MPWCCSTWPRCCGSPTAPAEAAGHVEKALDLFERKGNVVSAIAARSLLDELSVA